jgi:hypothetical protein
MTIVEKNNHDSPWLFRTQPLQAGTPQSQHEVSLQLAQPPTPIPVPITHHPIAQQKQQPTPPPPPPPQQQQQKHTSSIQVTPQRIQQNQILPARASAGPIPIDPRKVVKSSTAPNLPTSNSLSEMFRVI